MTGQLADLPSFRRIADIPFDAYMAALDSWRLTTHDGELRLGSSTLRGPIESDHHLGTRRIEVLLARGPLRPPVRMRLDVEPWSATATALELIPCQRVRPSADLVHVWQPLQSYSFPSGHVTDYTLVFGNAQSRYQPFSRRHDVSRVRFTGGADFGGARHFDARCAGNCMGLFL